MYTATKTWGHDCGWSVAFRQWRAKSHCRMIHGYPVAVSLEFGAVDLDENGWVVDFGALKPVKAWCAEQFDHKLAVAGDDPELPLFLDMHARGVADVIMWPNGVGMERFSAAVAAHTNGWLVDHGYAPRVSLLSATVREHGANGAGVVLWRG